VFFLAVQMNSQEGIPQITELPAGEDRRKHPRHRYLDNLYICKQNGTWHRATTFAISMGGLSVATTSELVVGEIVKLSYILGKEVYAIVRHRKGTMYGFEFLKLPPALSDKIQNLCETLPPFRSLADN
jgi:hypothetical protein